MYNKLIETNKEAALAYNNRLKSDAKSRREKKTQQEARASVIVKIKQSKLKGTV